MRYTAKRENMVKKHHQRMKDLSLTKMNLKPKLSSKMILMIVIQVSSLKYSICIHGSSRTCWCTLHLQEVFQSFGDLVHCSTSFLTLYTNFSSLTITASLMVLILIFHCSQLEWSSGVSCSTSPLFCSCIPTKDFSHLQIILLSSIIGHHLKPQMCSSEDGSTQWQTTQYGSMSLPC